MQPISTPISFVFDIPFDFAFLEYLVDIQIALEISSKVYILSQMSLFIKFEHLFCKLINLVISNPCCNHSDATFNNDVKTLDSLSISMWFLYVQFAICWSSFCST